MSHLSSDVGDMSSLYGASTNDRHRGQKVGKHVLIYGYREYKRAELGALRPLYRELE